MKNSKLNQKPKLLGLLALILLVLVGCSKQDLQPSASQNIKKSTGTDHGFFWQNYVSGGSATLTFPNADQYAGNFALSYSNVSDVVSGKGWNPGSSHSIGYNIGSLSGSYNNIGIYGWTTSPLIEYYVTEKGSVGGTYVNSISSDGHNYSFYKQQRVNAPSIQGTQTFWQYKDNWGGASVGQSYTVTMANHINNWRSNGGQGFGSYNLQILALEAYGGKSGYINATVWDAGSGGGSSSSSSSSSGGSSSSSSSSGGGSGHITLTLRARSTDGQGQVQLTVGGNNVGTWTLGTSYATHSVTLYVSKGDAQVKFTNDNGTSRDVQVDYLQVGSDTRQAENQATNTGVWQNSSCGGSYSEWLNCNGYIDFGNVSY